MQPGATTAVRSGATTAEPGQTTQPSTAPEPLTDAPAPSSVRSRTTPGATCTPGPVQDESPCAASQARLAAR